MAQVTELSRQRPLVLSPVLPKSKQTGEKSGGEGLGMSVWSHQADGGVSPEVH
jgi:hypothetical protein